MNALSLQEFVDYLDGVQPETGHPASDEPDSDFTNQPATRTVLRAYSDAWFYKLSYARWLIESRLPRHATLLATLSPHPRERPTAPPIVVICASHNATKIYMRLAHARTIFNNTDPSTAAAISSILELIDAEYRVQRYRDIVRHQGAGA